MREIHEILENLIKLMGFEECSVSFNEDSNRFSIFINDAIVTRYAPQMVADLDFLLKMVSNKKGLGIVFVDINNYRKEREDLIVQLAKASAKKASVSKENVSLPPMNAYERRIVHSELAMHPDIKTESEGEGKERHIVIKPI